MSNRRLVKALSVLLTHRMYDAVHKRELDNGPRALFLRSADLHLIPKYFLDRIEEDILARMLRLPDFVRN